MASFASRVSWPALYSCSGGTAGQDVDPFVETVKATAGLEYDGIMVMSSKKLRPRKKVLPNRLLTESGVRLQTEDGKILSQE